MTTTYSASVSNSNDLSVSNRNDLADDEQPEHSFPSNLGGLSIQVKTTSVVSGSDTTAPKRHALAMVFVEKVVEEYADRAMSHAQFRPMPDGVWVGEVIGLDGAWSDGSTEAEAREALPDIIFDWAMLKIADHDGDIPVIDGINLNFL